MEAAGSSLLDLTEDALSCILSFLRPADISACSRACKRLRELCSEDCKVWLPICERRWGSLTNIFRWGNGCIPYRLLYGTLARWEHLIGFWRGVGAGGCGFLALFEWAPHCIVGYKVVPAGLETYAVCRIPFLWMAISEDGQVMGFLDPTYKTLGSSDRGPWLKSSDGGPRTAISPSHKTILSPLNRAHTDPEALCERCMLLVDVHFVGNHHLVIEEITQAQLGCAPNKLAEAATLAAFGLSHNIAHQSSAAGGNTPYSNVNPETESCIGSPPGTFQHEMYQFLVSKVANAGGDRAASRKQKRRDKELALSQGKFVFEPEHFVKVVYPSPTKARPLQGLWKGFFDTVGLGFVLVFYDDKEGIVCRKVQDLGTFKSGSILWTSESTTRVMMPADEAFYNSLTHIGPLCSTAKLGEARPFEFCEEVIGIVCTSSCDFQSFSYSREGRIWQYANGTFGFGYLQASSVVDFRPVCADGSLLDIIK